MKIDKINAYTVFVSLMGLLLLVSIFFGLRIIHHQNSLKVLGISFQQYQQTNPSNFKQFAIIADTQRTSWQEYAFLFREINDEEQQQLFESLYTESLDFLIIGGDMVFDAASSKQWRHFDALMAPINKKGVQVFPALGNHEYWGDQKKAKQNIAYRFPLLKETFQKNISWYQFISGELGFILIDSNFLEMSESQWHLQLKFIKTSLAQMENNPTIRHIIFISHHPAFSNKPVVNGMSEVKEDIAPLFCATTKTKLFISGHAHGYERFSSISDLECPSRFFIISGGGGGPRPDTYLDEAETGLVDDYSNKGKRPLNYLLIKRTEEVYTVTTMGIIENSVIEIDQFSF